MIAHNPIYSHPVEGLLQEKKTLIHHIVNFFKKKLNMPK
jgi:hypothetical protein